MAQEPQGPEEEYYQDMTKENIIRIFVTVVTVAWLLLMPEVGYSGDADVGGHMLYMVSHAGAWHLAGNLFVLWMIRGKLYMIPSVLIAVACSFLPAWSLWGDMGMTMGMSGVLFAIVGIKWGVFFRCNTTAYRTFGRKVLPFALMGVLIPHVNWCLHTYCLIAGVAAGYVLQVISNK